MISMRWVATDTSAIRIPLVLLASLSMPGCTGPEQRNDVVTGAAEWSIDRAVVVFERRGPSANALYALDRATGREVRLTPEESNDWAGRVSPQGDHLLFVSRRDGDYEVYVSGIGGDDPRNITTHPDYDIVGAWSPRGDSVAFMSTRGYELGGEAGPFPGHVFVAALDGTGLRQVTRRPLTSSLGPTDWSPDGRWLTIAREVDGQLDVHLLDVASGEEVRVTSDPAAEYGATFSNDGARLAFHAEDATGARIVVADLRGGDRRVLSPPDHEGYSPMWSPDDRWLLYTRRGAGDAAEYDVVAVRVADGWVEPLVATPVDERASDWSLRMPGG